MDDTPSDAEARLSPERMAIRRIRDSLREVDDALRELDEGMSGVPEAHRKSLFRSACHWLAEHADDCHEVRRTLAAIGGVSPY